ncbi:hypothetical protein WJX72_006830 [[Myrmecia] bisecta]|uniref:guanylate cyclase n=1 Tax=[Myrmecia] bisecta TaxID=41462 RepID=A0AAW1PX05_9CHLO
MASGWKFSVTIPSWTQTTLEGDEIVVFYRVEVKVLPPDGDGAARCRSVLRRFSHFTKLHARLREELGNKAMAARDPPAKRALFGVNKKPELIERRRRELEQWLWKLIGDPDIARSRMLNNFLELSDAARLVQKSSLSPLQRPPSSNNGKDSYNLSEGSSPRGGDTASEASGYSGAGQLDAGPPFASASARSAAQGDAGAPNLNHLGRSVSESVESSAIGDVERSRGAFARAQSEKGASTANRTPAGQRLTPERRSGSLPDPGMVMARSTHEAGETPPLLGGSGNMRLGLRVEQRGNVKKHVRTLKQRLDKASTDLQDAIETIHSEEQMRQELSLRVLDLEQQLSTDHSQREADLTLAIEQERKRVDAAVAAVRAEMAAAEAKSKADKKLLAKEVKSLRKLVEQERQRALAAEATAAAASAGASTAASPPAPHHNHILQEVEALQKGLAECSLSAAALSGEQHPPALQAISTRHAGLTGVNSTAWGHTTCRLGYRCAGRVECKTRFGRSQALTPSLFQGLQSRQARPAKRGMEWLRASLVLQLTLLLLWSNSGSAYAQAPCTLRTGLDAGHTVGTASQWEATFSTYLNQTLGMSLNCTFQTVEYPTIDDLYNAVAAKDIDFVLTDVAIRECLEVEYEVSPIATLVNLVNGQETTYYGGSMTVLRSRTDLNSVHDVVGKRVVAGQSHALAGAAQMQWGELHDNGVSLFTDTKQVNFAPDSTQAILTVLRGDADVAFTRSDLIWKMAANGQVDANAFKILSPRTFANYPYPTSTPLYPEWAVGALPHVTVPIRNAIFQALAALNASNRAAQTVGYSTWTAPFSYLKLHSLQERIHYVNMTIGRCLRSQDFFGAIMCPAGQQKLAEDQVVTAAGCASQGSTCPEGYNCVCHPCIPLAPHRKPTTVLGMRLWIFCLIVGTVALVLGLSLCLCLRKHSMVVSVIPFDELNLHEESQELGNDEFGPVLKGSYRGTPVAVRRIVPHGSLKHLRHKHDCGTSVFGCEKYRLWCEAHHQKERRNSAFVVGVTGPMLASTASSDAFKRITQSFDLQPEPEQRVLYASMRRTSSLAPPKRAAKLQNSMCYFALCMCSMVLKDIVVSAASSVYYWSASGIKVIFSGRRRQRRIALASVQAAVQLRHPNIAAVMGVSTEPESGDLLLVESCVEGGSLFDFLHNTTVEVEADMAVSILQEVAAGMHFFHSMNPPMLNTELDTSTVMLDDLTHRVQLPNWPMHRPHASSSSMVTGAVATAPEVLRGEPSSCASDVYAFGILMYEVMTRKEPFGEEIESSSLMEVLQQVASLDAPEKRPQLPTTMTFAPELVSLLGQCWHADPAQRPSFMQIELILHQISSRGESAAAQLLRRKAEKLLLDQMLPPKVSAALREGRPVEPENYECVTIFFSDIVGFTNISGLLQPHQVMAMLDRLYRQFDALTSRFELFKVETIGDAYMVVSNLRLPQPDHAKRVADFATEAIAIANNTPILVEDPQLGNLHIRVGFHSGPVVASVVGNINPRYCLFGDTVNTASRMESTSLPDCIHMSTAACQCLLLQAPDYATRVLQRTQEQMVKGKGKMRTYWLSTKEGALQDPEPATAEAPAQQVVQLTRATTGLNSQQPMARTTTLPAKPRWRVTVAPKKAAQPPPPAPVPEPSTIVTIQDVQPMHRITRRTSDNPQLGQIRPSVQATS